MLISRSLAVLPDGRIFAGFDLGSAFEAVDVRSHYAIFGRRRRGRGASLRRPRCRNILPFSCTCGFSSSPDGGIVGVGAVWDRSRDNEGLASEQTGGFVETHPFLIRGSARSLTWESPNWLDAPLAGPFEICSPVFFAPDGDWLWPASTWKSWDGEAPHGMQAIVMRSTDQGASWKDWNAVMDGRENGHIHWEIKLAAFPDGRILAICWSHDSNVGKDLPVHFAISEDGGKTFGRGEVQRLTRSDSHFGQFFLMGEVLSI